MAKRSRSATEEEEEGQRSSMYVSFSKRREGLFQKAADLCVKCGAKIAIVVLSPTGNPFAFGHSSVDDVLRHYLGQTTTNHTFIATDEHKHQTERIEGLKFRIKQGGQKNDMENNVVLGVKKWIEEEWCEERETVEELEFLKEKYKNLLEKINNRLELGASSSGVEKDTIGYDGSGFTFPNTNFAGNDKIQFGSSNVGFVKNDMSFSGMGNGSSDDTLLNFYDGSGFTCAKSEKSDFVGNDKFQFSNSNVEFVNNDMSYGGIGSRSTVDALRNFYDGSGFSSCANSDFVGNNKFQFSNSNVEFVENDMSYAGIGSNSFGDASFYGARSVNILDSGSGFTCANSDFVGNKKFQFGSSNMEFVNPLNDMSYANSGSSSFGDAKPLLYDGSCVNILGFPDGGFTVPKK